MRIKVSNVRVKNCNLFRVLYRRNEQNDWYFYTLDKILKVHRATPKKNNTLQPEKNICSILKDKNDIWREQGSFGAFSRYSPKKSCLSNKWTAIFLRSVIELTSHWNRHLIRYWLIANPYSASAGLSYLPFCWRQFIFDAFVGSPWIIYWGMDILWDVFHTGIREKKITMARWRFT